VSEYLGGSRLWVAQKHGLPVPCVVNDRKGVLPDAEELPNLAAVLAKFTDRPRTAEFGPAGAYVNHLPYVHLPEDERYDVGVQAKIRRGIIQDVRRAVEEWLR